MARFARIMWDFQLAMYGYTKRENGLPSTPATVPVSSLKSPMKDLNQPLNEFWFKYVKNLNPPESKRFITAPHTGWVNEEWVEETAYPSVESLVMSGNVLSIREESEDYGQVDAFDFSNDRPDPTSVNYLSAPWKVHKFTVITYRNHIRNPGAGLDAYYPVFRHGEKLWIPLGRIEYFPELPCQVRIDIPTIMHDAALEPMPGLILPAGQTVQIREYRPTGSSVWGAVEGGWIPLLVNGTLSPTSWRMMTPPPNASRVELEQTDDPEPPPPAEYEVSVTAIRMIVRQSPGGSKVGELVYGRRVHVYQELTRQGVVWLRIGDKRWIPRDGTRKL
jgi:hypothetical protein